jgi:hypothetical protein
MSAPLEKLLTFDHNKECVSRGGHAPFPRSGAFSHDLEYVCSRGHGRKFHQCHLSTEAKHTIELEFLRLYSMQPGYLWQHEENNFMI